MSVIQEKRKKNIRGLFITVIAAAVIAAVALVLVEAQSGRFSMFDQRTETYYYSSDTNSVYSSVGDGFAAASGSGLQVFGKSGVQTLSETYIMDTPAISSGGKNAVVYDIGGSTVKIFSDSGILQSIKTDGAVISAKMSSGGWTALCTEEAGYQGAVYVYNSSGTLAYKWLSGSSYILSAAVSPDSKYLAVLCLGSDGTKIMSLKLDDEEYANETHIPDEILIDVDFADDGSVYGLSSSALYRISVPGTAETIYSFDDMHLSDYNIRGSVVLALNEHKSGGTCQIVSVQADGTVSHLANMQSGILSMSVGSKYTAVLTDTELNIYDTAKGELCASYSVSACVRVIVYDDGAVIAASRHWANVYSAKGN